MKKIFFLIMLILEMATVKGQDIVDKFLLEFKPIAERAEKVYIDGNSYYGQTSERAERYAIYCLEACSVIDKYVDRIDDINEQLDMLWKQVDILSDILNVYEQDQIGISSSEYNVLLTRKISSLKKLGIICIKITDDADRYLELYDVNKALGEHYFQHMNYKEASIYYSMCVSAYKNTLTGRYANDDDTQRMGQQSYYWMGYTAYKLGDKTIALNYYQKAKNILDNTEIKPYE